MKKCGKGCPTCLYIQKGKSVQIIELINGREIIKPYDCNSCNFCIRIRTRGGIYGQIYPMFMKAERYI